MASQGYPAIGLLVLLGLLTNGIAVSQSHDTASLNRTSFPKGFIFGTATAAYQYEGAAFEDGKGPSIWDTYTHERPERIKNRSNGDVAVDQYHRYKGDVRLMKKIGLDGYRFSISWSRVLPKGKLSGGVNRAGIKYYNNLINKLLANGIQPFVTLYHWDLPQALQDEYGGFLSPHFVDDFRDYAELCFKEFGDRVKHWITLNEPLSQASGGYADGLLPPARCSSWQKLNCTAGDSGTEPYLAAHHEILAHASAVEVYRQKYQKVQKGIMGISLNSNWYVPFSNSTHDREAAQRSLDFKLGWFMDPLSTGDYPHNSHADTSPFRNGVPIGPRAASDWIYVYPRGLRDILLYIKKKYHNPLIFITENGTNEFNNASLPLKEALDDSYRIDYHYQHFQYLLRSIKDGVNVQGYFACWSIQKKILLLGLCHDSAYDTASLNRTSFPEGFIFGTAAAAYQYEGAAYEDGKGPNIWDTYTHEHPERIVNGSNGDVAVDQYHRYKGDVRIMKKMGLDAYRFSISWSRVLPKGKLSGGVNREGIKYYNKLINKLLDRGILPFVTLFHWDLPQALEDEYGGFLSPHIVDDFRDYAELCYKEFGDRVKHWITLNEPLSYSNGGYVTGDLAPGRCSSWQEKNCTGGDSGTEPYFVSHNQLLAHASAVEVYRQKYQEAQKGLMGISLVGDWVVPYSNATQDQDAAQRAHDFRFGWFMDPLTNADAPKAEKPSYLTDLRANLSSKRNGIPIGAEAASSWLHVYPRGI
nr:beta-glucosidase 12 [Quercus suber]